MRQGLLQTVRQGIDHVAPPIVLVGDELLQDGDRGGGRAHPIAPVLHAPPAAGGVREVRPLAQEAADLDPGVHALLESPDELHDGPVTEHHRAVGLLGGERDRRVALGQEPVELPKGRRGEAEELAPAPSEGTTSRQQLDHHVGERRLEHGVEQDPVDIIGPQIGHHRVGMPLLELLGLDARGEGEG